MDTQKNIPNITAFTTIKEFLLELWNVFGDLKKEKSFALYVRLISKIKPTDTDLVNKIITSFRVFIQENETFIASGKIDKLTSNLIYNNNEKIYVNIHRYFTRADPDVQDVIKKYLLTINALLFPKQELIDALEKDIDMMGVDRSTPEGRYVSDALRKISDMGNIEDPQQAAMVLMSSGILQEVLQGVDEKIKSGEFSRDKFQSAVSSCMGMMMSGMRDEGGDPEGLVTGMLSTMGIDKSSVDMTMFGMGDLSGKSAEEVEEDSEKRIENTEQPPKQNDMDEVD